MTLSQVAGYVNAPKRDLSRLALTAQRALLRADELELQVRQLQGRLAAMELESAAEVIVIHRDGLVEVFAEAYRRTKIVNRPDLGRNREDEADEWVLKRLPLSHRLLMQSTERLRVAVGHVSGCMDRYRFECLQADLDQLKAINELKESANHAVV